MDTNNTYSSIIANSSIAESKSSEEQIYNIYNKYTQTGTISLFEIIILLIAFSSLTVSGLNHLRLLKTPVRDVITYLNLNHIKETREIENILQEMLAVSQCHRVLIGLFHNGTSVGTHHFNKMSVFYEVVAPSISPLRDKTQNVLLYKLYDEIENNTGDTFSKYSREDKDLKPRCIMHLDNIGVKESLKRLLVDSDKGIYGIVELQWVNFTSEDIMKDTSNLAQLDILFNRLVSHIEGMENNKKRLFNFKKFN
jgi:hypothetical protein